MPVAVGHHVYRDDVDRDALERDWNGWLAATFTG
jgi:hypothetical protein